MITSEENARKLHCPLFFAHNHSHTDKCLAAKCMLWIWADQEDGLGRCGLGPEPGKPDKPTGKP